WRWIHAGLGGQLRGHAARARRHVGSRGLVLAVHRGPAHRAGPSVPVLSQASGLLAASRVKEDAVWRQIPEPRVGNTPDIVCLVMRLGPGLVSADVPKSKRRSPDFGVESAGKPTGICPLDIVRQHIRKTAQDGMGPAKYRASKPQNSHSKAPCSPN